MVLLEGHSYINRIWFSKIQDIENNDEMKNILKDYVKVKIQI